MSFLQPVNISIQLLLSQQDSEVPTLIHMSHLQPFITPLFACVFMPLFSPIRLHRKILKSLRPFTQASLATFLTPLLAWTCMSLLQNRKTSWCGQENHVHEPLRCLWTQTPIQAIFFQHTPLFSNKKKYRSEMMVTLVETWEVAWSYLESKQKMEQKALVGSYKYRSVYMENWEV